MQSGVFHAGMAQDNRNETERAVRLFFIFVSYQNPVSGS